MAITGINNSSYTSYYASNYKNTVKKTDSEKDSTNTKDGNVTTSTVELKTSRPGVTKTEQIKTGYSNVNDYSKYLQGKYHYMNIGLTSMQGIPTTVSVSSAFLQKCMNDPEKAKYLEENLAAIPDCTKDTINGCLGTVTNQSYMIDANGNIIETASCTNDPDGKIAKENAERKAKENREKEEKVKEKRAAKKAEEEKAAKKRAEKLAERKETGNYTLSVTGTDVKSMTQSLVAGSPSVSSSSNARSLFFFVWYFRISPSRSARNPFGLSILFSIRCAFPFSYSLASAALRLISPAVASSS